MKFKLEITEEEANVLAQLMDAGVKSLGLSCVEAAAHLKRLLETATPVPEEDSKGPQGFVPK